MPEWIGKTIGNVRIEKLLARGGMAEVYLGTHLNLQRPVAVKILHGYVEDDPVILERFHREAKVVAGLRHPNIVQVYDFDAIDGHPYLVMEYLKGPTLAAYLRTMHQRKKRVPPDQVARLLKVLTSALDYAHGQGIIHRDIKPSNILLHNKADEIPLDKPLTNDVEVVITDFGLVRVVNSASETTSGMITGTPAYMSPEQARGDQVDHRTDIYSLGIIFYEMLAGRVPFDADSTMTILHMQIHTPPPTIPGLSPAVQAVLNRALAKRPDDRYQTSGEMAVDFFRAIGMATQAEIAQESRPVSSLPAEPAETPIDVRRKEPISVPQKVGPTPRDLPSKPKEQTAPKPTLQSEPRIEPVAKPKPARSKGWTWIGGGLLVLLCLAGLAVGAVRFLPSILKAAATASSAPVIVNTNVSAGSSATPAQTTALPSGDGMVKVPAGTYEVGFSPADDYHVTPMPINLRDFWIDQYQTTNTQYQQYMTATGAPPPVVWPGDGNHPARGVTWDQAQAYCTWAKKRLPSEAEWEAAGRGAGKAPPLYPWGNDSTAGGQVTSLPEDDTYPVGTLAFNKSPFGVFDMMGNVWEWVGEPYAQAQAGYRFLRGGRYGIPLVDLAYRLGVAPGDTRYIRYAGFRCAADQVK